MYSALTKEEIMEWRRTTEKITLEEFAARIGKSVTGKKETNDLHDILLKKKEEPDNVQEIQEVKKEIKQPKEPFPRPQQEKAAEPDFGIKITFNKKLNKREELVFNYFWKNKNRKVMVKDIAKILNLPNDYVYKYIKNLRSKLEDTEMLENADKGGYILHA